MNLLRSLKKSILDLIQKEFSLTDAQLKPIQVTLNVDKVGFGDLAINAALILAKILDKSPIEIAKQLKKKIKPLAPEIETIEIAGPGFLNITLTKETWQNIAHELSNDKNFFKLDESVPRKKYSVEFVSANPTGPLHLGHGRGGIIGDVLANVLNFLGHKADKEYYINDAGNQIQKLGNSLKIRCQQELGQQVDFPDDGYAGDYLVDLAKKCIEHYGKKVIEENIEFFTTFAKEQLLELIKKTLDSYGVTFDRWFSETPLHKSGAVERAIELLKEKELAYTKDDALWFCSSKFGDDKDRVLQKADGLFTYIAADIAYHQDKFERGYDQLIDILGQDHHGYVKRLKATMKAIGYDDEKLHVILYQLVSITRDKQAVRMSKRTGKFEKLSDVIEQVGVDVARFFYLNRKADAHLEFDMDVALKKTEENPVYYIQYAYVRTNSLLTKAKEDKIAPATKITALEAPEIKVLKKICSLETILRSIESTYQTHMLAYYTLELAKTFHAYYANNKIIDLENLETSQSRLALVKLLNQTFALCLDLLGLSKPERM
ncbi:arginine--tRNA ligase [Candidatus Babeliales bacterium]|nr:arginine--tRNA ligase [Candidatus Babeliales bacterium]